MSIRRVGFNPFVNSANFVEAQKRVEAVEKHAGTEDTELKTEEEALESLNAEYRAELEALEAERAEQQAKAESLRTELVLRDGYEKRKEGGPVDLTGGVEEPIPEPTVHPDDFQSGVSLASLARQSVYQTVSREEQRAAARQAELEREAAQRALAEHAAARRAELEGVSEAEPREEGEEEGELDEDWMKAELSALEARNDSTESLDEDEDEEGYQDPGADAFFASLEDIENLEAPQGQADTGNGFFASLDDIAHLVPESPPEEMDPQAAAVSPPDAPAVQAPVESMPVWDSIGEPAVAREPAVASGETVTSAEAVVSEPIGPGEAAGPGASVGGESPPDPVAVSAPLPKTLMLPFFDDEVAPVAARPPESPESPEPSAPVMLPFDSDSSS